MGKESHTASRTVFGLHTHATPFALDEATKNSVKTAGTVQ